MINPVRARLEAGEVVLGLTIATNNLETAALGATLGFHFLWVEMEHSPVSLEALRNIVLATRALPAMIFARVPVIETWCAKRVLDQGAAGVIFPFCSTPELARTAVASCHYPPSGTRGSGAGLASITWPDPENYYDSADENVMVVCVIEQASAVEQIDQIAATPGIDVLFIGTSDLSFSLGLRGRQNEPKLDEAIEKVVTAAQKHRKFLGRPAGSADEVVRYRQQGFQFFQSATEIGLMELGAETMLKPLGIAKPKAATKMLY